MSLMRASSKGEHRLKELIKVAPDQTTISSVRISAEPFVMIPLLQMKLMHALHMPIIATLSSECHKAQRSLCHL